MSQLPVIELNNGALRVALRPDLGGCIAGFWFDTLPVLRSTEGPALAAARASGGHALLPYADRLGYRRLRWHGREHTTRANVEGSPHSVDGVGWQRPWTVASARASDAVLSLAHAPDADWPFGFEATQVFALTDGALNLGLKISNTGSVPAPAGLGWRLCFPKRSRSRLHAELTERWEADATGLPTRPLPQSGIDADVAHLAYDHCFGGWVGAARVRDEKLSLRLSASLPCLLVHTPALEDHFSLAPASHVSNALHMAEPARHGLRTLMPGEHFEAWTKIEVGAV